MKEINPHGLIVELSDLVREAGNIDNIVEKPYMVVDEMFGLKDGVYAPLGSLRLPVVARFDDVSLDGNYFLGLFTAFTDRFLSTGDVAPREFTGDHHEMFEHLVQGVGGNVYFDEVSRDDLPTVLISDANGYHGAKPSELLLGSHIPNFLTLHERAKKMDADTESIRAIRRCFTSYE